MLSVTLNRELRTEVFRSPVTGKLLLEISYNANMQPTRFSTLPPPQPDVPSGFADMGATLQPPPDPLLQQHALAPLRLLYTRSEIFQVRSYIKLC